MQRRRFLRNALPALGFLLPLRAQTPDPWPATDMLEPEQLAKQLSSNAPKTPVVCVGFPVLYRAAHISGAILAGPSSKPEALEALRKTVDPWPRNAEIIFYCGCCPFDHCPNIRPAYRALREMGFERLRVLRIPNNLHSDWVIKGYPTQKNTA